MKQFQRKRVWLWHKHTASQFEWCHTQVTSGATAFTSGSTQSGIKDDQLGCVNAYTCAEWCMCTYIYIVLLRLIGSNCNFNSHLFSAKSQRAWKSVGTSLAASRHAGLFVLTDFKVTAERTRRHSFNSLSRSPLRPGRPASTQHNNKRVGWTSFCFFWNIASLRGGRSRIILCAAPADASQIMATDRSLLGIRGGGSSWADRPTDAPKRSRHQPLAPSSPSHLGRRARSDGKREFDPDGDVRRKFLGGASKFHCCRKGCDVGNCLWFADKNYSVGIRDNARWCLRLDYWRLLLLLSTFKEMCALNYAQHRNALQFLALCHH